MDTRSKGNQYGHSLKNTSKTQQKHKLSYPLNNVQSLLKNS